MRVDECLQDVVGFFRKLPICLEEEGYEWGASKSNLYLSELKGIDLAALNTAHDCEGLIELMQDVKINAIQAFKSDLAVEMSKAVERTLTGWQGNIGGTAFAGRAALNKPIKGVKLFSGVRGGTMVVKGITLMLDTAERVDLTIYEVEDGVFRELATFGIDAEAGKAVKFELDKPLRLKLDAEYYFLYSSNGEPLMTKFGCCGFSQRYSNSMPTYGNNAKIGWSRWLVGTGVYGDDLGSLKEHRTPCGISLDVRLGCDAMSILCNEGMDFANDVVPLSIAHSLRYKMGEFLLDAIVDRGAVNRYTLLTIESLNANREYYLERYAALLGYIAQEINYFDVDCWKCKDKLVRRGQLL